MQVTVLQAVVVLEVLVPDGHALLLEDLDRVWLHDLAALAR